MSQEDKFKKVIAHAKEYGFVFQSSEIYDGLSAVYDYGQNGALLKNNICNVFLVASLVKQVGHVPCYRTVDESLLQNKFGWTF